MYEKYIFLIDMDAYFASVEQMCNPMLYGKPVVVAGEGRTVITTASYEARRYGIKTGMTLPEAKKLCPDLIVVKGDLNKYIDTSLKIHKILLDFTDRVEVFSIDECFLDVTDSYKLFGTPNKMAEKIKHKIRQELGLTCSIGIGPNKTIAKLAAKKSKPDGILEVKGENVKEFLSTLPIEELQGVGIGEKTAEKLKYLGINTAAELGETPLLKLKMYFGINGIILKKIGQGIYDTPVKKYLETDVIKSVGHSYTLPADTDNIDIIKSFLLLLSEKVGKRMRKYNLIGKTIILTVRYFDFKTFSKRKTMKFFTSDSMEIYNETLKIFMENFNIKRKIRLLGVSVANLFIDNSEKYLFEIYEKKRKFLRVIDEINDKFGDFTIKPASILLAENYGIVKKCALIGSRLLKR